MRVLAAALQVVVAAGVLSHQRKGNFRLSAQNTTDAHLLTEQPKCTCQKDSPTWKKPTRTQPQCVFIDLGAADGNSFSQYLNDYYGVIQQCPSGGLWEAYLVEANPTFKPALEKVVKNPGKCSQSGCKEGKVHAFAPEAAFMCSGQTSFFIDSVNHDKNYWGSSMSNKHPDVVRSGQKKVTVPTVNVIQLVAENAIPGDWVTVKMDVEGAEWDILPCLASSDHADLIDELLVEWHSSELGTAGYTASDTQAAIMLLKTRGVRIPDYNSPTL